MTPPPPPPPPQMPVGTPLAAFLEGMLDGRIADAPRLHAAVSALQKAGAGAFRSEMHGGRFSLLPAATQLPAGAFDEAAQARFVAALHELVAAAAPNSIETNLRCKLVYAEQVAETLFVARGDRIEPMTRLRARTAADGTGVPTVAAAVPFGLRRREVLFAAPLLLLAGSLVAWRSGWIDRILAARAEALRIDTGPFADLLQVATRRAWGDYRVELRRGAGYPADAVALGARRDGAKDLVTRAAIASVGDGGEVFVQLVDAQDVVLAEARAELRPLLTTADAVVEARLPGHRTAAALRLSLTKAPEPK